MPAHAHLVEATGRVVGGAALREEEWLLVLNGEVAATTDSPGMVLAMLRHTAAVLNRAGRDVQLRFSDVLRERATTEAAEAGKSLDAFLEYLEAERAEMVDQRNAGPLPDALH